MRYYLPDVGDRDRPQPRSTGLGKKDEMNNVNLAW